MYRSLALLLLLRRVVIRRIQDATSEQAGGFLDQVLMLLFLRRNHLGTVLHDLDAHLALQKLATYLFQQANRTTDIFEVQWMSGRHRDAQNFGTEMA